MTPLARFLRRFLPAPLVTLALALAYALMMFSILISRNVEMNNNIYVDVRGD